MNAGHHGTGATGPAVSALTTAPVSVGGGVLWGALLGVLGVGVVDCLLEPAIPGPPGLKSYLLGAAGFVTVSGAPWLVLAAPVTGGRTGRPDADPRRLMPRGGRCGGPGGAAGYLYNAVREAWGRLRATVTAGGPLLLLVGLAVLVPGTPTSTERPQQFIAAYQEVIGFSPAALWFALAGVRAWMVSQPPSGTPQPNSRTR